MTRDKTLPVATDDPLVIRNAVFECLERVELKKKVRLLGTARKFHQQAHVAVRSIIQPQQCAPPPLEFKRCHRQHGIRIEDNDFVVVGLLARGARKVLAIKLDAHVVAVVPPSATAAR